MHENLTDVRSYISVINETRIENACETLTSRLKQPQVPIYRIHYRIKSPESTYFKLKRKKKSLGKITDYAGLRILCLYEQDIYEIHKHLIDEVSNLSNSETDFSGAGFEEFKMYNLDGVHFEANKKVLQEYVTKTFDSCDIMPVPTASGYKSFHYLLDLPRIKHNDNRENHKIEIQLRTVIQDVWSELEHSLAYKKGNISPQINDNFKVIANHLSAIDSVIASLYELSVQEKTFATLNFELVGPRQIFYHEPWCVHPDIQGDERFRNYISFLGSRKDNANIENWVESGRVQINDLDGFIEQSGDVSSKYWIECENAYWAFCGGLDDRYKKALDAYQSILESEEYHDLEDLKLLKYLIHFRIGEIKFIRDDVLGAFDEFDKCESVMPMETKNQYENLFKVTLHIAYFYWRLGRNYSHLAFERCQSAENWIKVDDPVQQVKYLNSKTWYLLELCILDKKTESKQSADKKAKASRVQDLSAFVVELLETCVSDEKLVVESGMRGNIYHTLAYALFFIVQLQGTKTKNRRNLQKLCNKIHSTNNIRNNFESALFGAIRFFCQECIKSANGAYHLEYSLQLQRKHVEEMLVACDRYDKTGMLYTNVGA